MRDRLALSALIVGAVVATASPAHAAWTFTLPVAASTLDWGRPGQGTSATGAGVNLLWLSGQRNKLRAQGGVGYTYLRDGAGNGYHYVTGEAQLAFQLPLGPITPYVGGVGRYWLPLAQPGGLRGQPFGLGPLVGIDLNVADSLILGLAASYMPVQGLSDTQGGVPADLSVVGGKVTLTF